MRREHADGMGARAHVRDVTKQDCKGRAMSGSDRLWVFVPYWKAM